MRYEELMKSLGDRSASPKGTGKIAFVEGCGLSDKRPSWIDKTPPVEDDSVRAWMSESSTMPRVLDVAVFEGEGSDEMIVSLMRFTKEFVEVCGEDLGLECSAMHGGPSSPRSLEKMSCIEVKRYVQKRLNELEKHEYVTYVVDRIVDGVVQASDEYETLWEGVAGLREAVSFGKLKFPETASWEPTGGPVEEIVPKLRAAMKKRWKKEVGEEKARRIARGLKTTGTAGLMRWGGKMMEGLLEAMKSNMFDSPLSLDEYELSAREKLSETHVVMLTRLGILCPMCSGMTWGFTGHEMAKMIREAVE